MTANGRRFLPDASVGNLDLVFLLLTLFFLTTMISVRPLGLAEEVSADEAGADRQPIVLEITRLPTRSEGLPSVALISSGGLESPQTGQRILSWLDRTCKESARTVQVQCPENATHLQCKRGLAAVKQQAGQCRYQY